MKPQRRLADQPTLRSAAIPDVRRTPRPIAMLLALIVIALFTPALSAGEIHMPTGEYRETVEDLKVKVRGGFVAISRSWRAVNLNQTQYRWYFNPVWSGLEFELDVIDGTPKTITRVGSTFDRNAAGDTFVYQDQYFIKPQRDGQGATTAWRWYDRRGNWVVYDLAGKIASYGDRNGMIVTFERDASGHISRLLDANGALVMSYQYDGDNLSSIQDRSGRSVQYHYSGSILDEVIDTLGNSWTYEYSGGLLTTCIDPEGHVTVITYNANRAVRVRDAEGHETNYDYDYDRTTRQYTVVQRTPENRRIETHYDADGIAILEKVGERTTLSLQRDGASVDIVTDERGLRTRYEYDSARNLTKVVWPDGTVITQRYESTFCNPIEKLDERGIRTIFEYDINGNLTRQTEGDGTSERRVTDFSYDGHGQRLSSTIRGLASADDSMTVFSYDSYGNPVTITDGEGRSTNFEFDVMGNVDAIRDAADARWEIITSATGLVTSQKTPLGHETKYEYDRVGNMTKFTDPKGGVTSLSYDGMNRLLRIIDPLGGTSQTVYGGDGELLSRTDQVGSKITFAYDTDGRIKSASDDAGNTIVLRYGDASSGLAGLVSGIVFPTYSEEYHYDNRNRPLQIIRIVPGTSGQPDTRLVSQIAYDATGRPIAEMDPLGRATIYRWDRLYRPTEIVDARGATTHFVYDSGDNLRSITDPNGHGHGYSYDRAHQVLSESTSLGNTTRYNYDVLGNPTARTNADGSREVRDYDLDGRVLDVKKFAIGAVDPSQIVTFTYDDANLPLSYTQTGDSDTSAAYVYDGKGQKLSETVNYRSGASAISWQVAYTYRSNGQKLSFTYPEGTHVEYSYGSNNLLTQLTTPGGGAISFSAYQWNKASQVVTPGVVRRIAYDGLQRPTAIVAQAIGGGTPSSPSGPVIMDYGYVYDAAGNIRGRHTEDGAYQYEYDQTDRLTTAIPPAALQQDPANPSPEKLPVEGYTYDTVGNRLTSLSQPGEWVYDTDNRLTSYGVGAASARFAYDQNGNMVAEFDGDATIPTRTLAYNVDGSLRSVSGPQGEVTYDYDPFGRMIHSRSPSGGTWYLYSDEGLVSEVGDSGVLKYAYGWRPDRPWSTDPLWLGTKAGALWSVNYYQNDNTYTPHEMTSEAGTLTWRGKSESFGRTYADVRLVNNQLRSPGQFEDEFTAIYYNFLRHYDAGLGRYLQPDPLGFASNSLNLFAYVNANPMSFIDPTGLARCTLTFHGDRPATLSCIPDNPLNDPVSIPVASGNNGWGGSGCKNNPACSAYKDLGPIPLGDWRWTNGSTTKPLGRRLIPMLGTNDFNRPDILTHSCSFPFGPSKIPKFCSGGCVTGTEGDIGKLNKLLDAEPGSTLFVTSDDIMTLITPAPMTPFSTLPFSQPH